jgi:hypothetical protein
VNTQAAALGAGRHLISYCRPAWIITRTVGSLVGPAATEPAKVGFCDLVSTALEALIVAGCLGLLWRRPQVSTGWWAEHALMIAALGFTPSRPAQQGRWLIQPTRSPPADRHR